MRELKSRIITSGALLNFNDGTKTDWHKFAPIAQQGGGYVNAKKVFYATSLLPGKLELKDTSSFVRDHYINVTNSGSEDVWYTLSHLPAATVNTFEDGSSDPQSFPPKLLVDSGNSSSSTAAVRFFPTVPFSLRPGETSRFMVSFTPPTLPPEPLPIYSGKIIVTGSNAETISLPYQGLAGSLKSVDIWELAVSPPRFLNEGTDEDILQPTNFTLKGLDRYPPPPIPPPYKLTPPDQQ